MWCLLQNPAIFQHILSLAAGVCAKRYVSTAFWGVHRRALRAHSCHFHFDRFSNVSVLPFQFCQRLPFQFCRFSFKPVSVFPFQFCQRFTNRSVLKPFPFRLPKNQRRFDRFAAKPVLDRFADSLAFFIVPVLAIPFPFRGPSKGIRNIPQVSSIPVY